MTLRMAPFPDDSRVSGHRRMTPLPQRRRQQLLAAIQAQPGISREELEAQFAHVNRWTLRSAMKWLVHLDGLVRFEGVRSPRRRYFPVESVS